MKITVLIENTSVNDKFYCEHGLSLYIKTNNNTKILFDMGQTDLFIKNAEILGIDLPEIDIAVLSHGHYDHGGGLKAFLEINKKAPVYINKHAFEPHFNGTEKYIGLDLSLEDNERLIYTDDNYRINDSLSLYTCNDKRKLFELGSFGLNKLENDKFIDDDFNHEQYLLIKEDNKDILISGCSHKGILNISDWFKADTIVGGFHFSKFPLDDTLKSYAEKLSRCNTEYFTCHCTGDSQYDFMKKYMNNLNYISSGSIIEI